MAPREGLVIRTEGLRKSYGTHAALDGLDLEVPSGTVFGFLGPNGAGKTTTLKILLGLARSGGGRAEVFGQEVSSGTFEVRRRIGFLAQEPRYYPHLTARETLAFVGRFFGLGSAREEARRIGEALDLAGIPELADRRVGGFSGGERQRLGLAQAQIHEPDLLILDEPAAALDPMGRRDVLGILERLKGRATVFFSTHILDDVQRVADEVAILSRGRRRAQAPVDELLEGDGSVYTVRLVGGGETLLADLQAQAWVRQVEAARDEGADLWTVHVTDPALADERLLRTLLNEPDVTVREFRRRSASLEDVFVRIVEGAAE